MTPPPSLLSPDTAGTGIPLNFCSWVSQRNFVLYNAQHQIGGANGTTQPRKVSGRLLRGGDHLLIGTHGANGRQQLPDLDFVSAQRQADFGLCHPSSLSALICGVGHADLRDTMNNGLMRRPHAAM